MMHKFLGIFAFAVLAGFLAILVIHVPRLDLTVVIGVTVLLAGWDMVMNLRGDKT
jgi:hypothetical protein